MQAAADRRAELNLHIDLLAEHEVTRIVTQLTAVGQQPLVFTRDVQPEKMLERMNEVEQEAG